MAKSHQPIVLQANRTASKFAEVFNLFGECHRGYNSSFSLSDKDIDNLGKKNYYLNNKKCLPAYILTEADITAFLVFYRKNFPLASILPKMHILEDHVILWMRRWKVGSGIMGEQGAESIHAHINQLERTYQGIPNEVDRLKYIFREQALESDPSLTSLRPPLKKRKKNAKDAEVMSTS